MPDTAAWDTHACPTPRPGTCMHARRRGLGHACMPDAAAGDMHACPTPVCVGFPCFRWWLLVHRQPAGRRCCSRGRAAGRPLSLDQTAGHRCGTSSWLQAEPQSLCLSSAAGPRPFMHRPRSALASVSHGRGRHGDIDGPQCELLSSVTAISRLRGPC